LNSIHSIETLLKKLKADIENYPVTEKHLKSSSNANGFEDLVADIIKNINLPNIKFHIHYGKHFPDIDVLINNKKYGIELKSRLNGGWTNNGGSIFESVTSQDYENIYLLFGSINKSKDNYFKVRYCPYWQSLTDIKVTHKPRYYIDLTNKNSIFDSQESYEKLRNASENEKNIYVQEILRTRSNKPQWYLTEPDEIYPTAFNDLPEEKKKNIIAEFFILFPHDLINTNRHEKNKSNYKRISKVLVSKHFYYDSSIRDLFSAGGVFKINGIDFPQIIKKMIEYREILEKILESADADFQFAAYNFWYEIGFKADKNINFYNNYLKLLDHLGENNFKNTLYNSNTESLSTLIFKTNHTT